MSQPRCSARLAARSQSAHSPPLSLPSQPTAIDLTDAEHNSGGLLTTLSRSLTSTCSPSLPASSVTGTSPLLGLSLSLRLAVLFHSHSAAVHHRFGARVFPISDLPRLQRSIPFIHGLPPLSAPVLHSPAGECMICSGPQSMVYSFSVPCCRQRIHYECLARSVHSSGDRCPFYTQDLVPVLSDPLLAASLENLDVPNDPDAPPANAALNSLSVPDDLPRSPPTFPLCCTHTCGPPDFEHLNDRRME